MGAMIDGPKPVDVVDGDSVVEPEPKRAPLGEGDCVRCWAG